MTTDEMKRSAAEAAAELVQDGMSIGLGSGSTARAFTIALGRRVADGLTISAVASSQATAALAQSCDIPLIDLDRRLDLAVDGADAIAHGSLAAIKGLGGALTRERIVADHADRFVLIADETKLFDRLESALRTIPIPVAVVPFGWMTTRARLSSFGHPELRLTTDGQPFCTDDGNFILDLHLRREHLSPDWTLADLADQIKRQTGVVDHGLFLDLASRAYIGTSGSLRTLERDPG